jgi:serine/threonine-protein kinase
MAGVGSAMAVDEAQNTSDSASSESDAVGKSCPTCGGRYPNDYAVCPKDATPLAREGQQGDPLLGQVLGDTYEITRMLGEGGMGRVYEARHVRLGRRFALTMVHQHFLGDAESVARFRREASAAASVLSPNVAEVFDVHATRDGRPYLVCELLEGEELAAVLAREGTLSVVRAVSIARQVSRGLAAAHAASVVHRDLKPENIMLLKGEGDRELAKVVDFGIAKSLTDNGSLTRTGVILGTPAYMAPEQAKSGGTVDARVDVYALGAVLYRSLTGKPAFTGDDPSATLASVLYDEPQRPRALRDAIPDGLELVVQRAMAKDPDARYGSMAELDAALAPFDEPAVAPTEAEPRRTASPADVTAPAGSDVSRAATVALGGSGTQAAAFSDAAKARTARPRAVAYAVLLVSWIALGIAAAVSAVFHGLNRRAMQPIESLLAGIVAFVVVAPMVTSMLRDIRRGAWRNTAGMLARAEVLARVLGWSFGAYAVIAVAWRVWDGVIARRVGLSHWADAASLSAALVTALVVWWRQSRRVK